MSTELPRFLLEVTLVWTALLLFYLVAFRRNANWKLRRRYLLSSFGLGILIPFLPSVDYGGPVAAARLSSDLVGYIIPATGTLPAASAEADAYTWTAIATAIWVTGSLLYLIIAIAGLLRHLRPAAPNLDAFAAYAVVRSAHIHTPYAAFGKIYLPAALPAKLERTALLHEAAHLRHGHFHERLWLVMGTALFWFHPLSWVYARLLSAVHEYEADAEVARHVPVKTYGRQLLQASLAPHLVPALFSSPLKKRIMMLTTHNTSRNLGPLRWATLLILFVGLLLACSEVPEEFRFAEQQDPPLKFDLTQMQELDAAPQLTDEESPSFLHAIYGRITYPPAARTENMEGGLSASMTISKSGEVVDITTIRQPVSGNNRVVVTGYGNGGQLTSDAGSTYFTDEVQRVLKELGPFRPAMVDGEARSARIVMDFSFRLR